MAYNSAHTGPEIDAAVSAVKEKETIWDDKAAAPSMTQVTLPAASWSGSSAPYTQSVSVTGILADETAQSIIVTPAADSDNISAVAAAGVYCTGQGADTLTFSAQEKPTANLQFAVSWQDAQYI